MERTNKLAVANRLCSAGCRKSLYGDLLTVAPAIFAGHGRVTLNVVLFVGGVLAQMSSFKLGGGASVAV